MINDVNLTTVLGSLVAITVMLSVGMFGMFVSLLYLSRQNRLLGSIVIETMKKKDEKSFKSELNQLEAECILEDLERKINHYNS